MLTLLSLSQWEIAMLKSMLVVKNVQTWYLIGGKHIRQPIKWNEMLGFWPMLYQILYNEWKPIARYLKISLLVKVDFNMFFD